MPLRLASSNKLPKVDCKTLGVVAFAAAELHQNLALLEGRCVVGSRRRLGFFLFCGLYFLGRLWCGGPTGFRRGKPFGTGSGAAGASPGRFAL